jgi:predicted nucleic acid-binding protein
VIVVDATVWVDKLRGMLAEHLSDAIWAAECISPPHVDFEVGAALLRLERRGDLQPGQARELIIIFGRHPVERARHAADAVAAADMIGNATYADAWYLAMAKRLGCPIISTDNGMKTAAVIHGIPVVEGTNS